MNVLKNTKFRIYRFFSNIWKNVKKIYSLLKEKFLFLLNLVLYSVVYGLVVNYMLAGIFGISFRLWSIPAYGVLVYLIKEELPVIWARFRR